MATRRATTRTAKAAAKKASAGSPGKAARNDPAGAAAPPGADARPDAAAPDALVATDLVFVYGTLKEGFPNFRVNRGRRVAGEYVCVVRRPLYVVGDDAIPWLVDAPGTGHAVAGELYRIDADALAAMDVLEEVGRPRGYRRELVDVVAHPPRDGDEPLRAWVYLKPLEDLVAGLPHYGPLTRYEHDDAALYAEYDDDATRAVKREAMRRRAGHGG